MNCNECMVLLFVTSQINMFLFDYDIYSQRLENIDSIFDLGIIYQSNKVMHLKAVTCKACKCLEFIKRSN